MQELKVAQEEIEQNKEEVIEKLVKFSLTDTLVFWGHEKDLIAKQEKTWGPILKWASQNLDFEIKSTHSLNVPEENLESGYRIKNFLQSLSTKELTAFYKASLLMKSVLLAMAFVKKRVNATEAFEAALLEEKWQNQIWGSTDEVLEDQEKLKAELIEIEKFLES